MELERSTVIRYSVCFFALCIVAFIVISCTGIYAGGLEVYEIMRKFSDAFTVSGAIGVCIGGLVGVSNTGFFDSFAYMGRMVVNMFVPFVGTKKPTSYRNYKEAKMENRKHVKYAFIIICGIIHLVVAMIFMVLFYAYRPA